MTRVEGPKKASMVVLHGRHCTPLRPGAKFRSAVNSTQPLGPTFPYGDISSSSHRSVFGIADDGVRLVNQWAIPIR